MINTFALRRWMYCDGNGSEECSSLISLPDSSLSGSANTTKLESDVEQVRENFEEDLI